MLYETVRSFPTGDDVPDKLVFFSACLQEQLISCNPQEMSTTLSAAVVLTLPHLHKHQQQQQQQEQHFNQGSQRQQQHPQQQQNSVEVLGVQGSRQQQQQQEVGLRSSLDSLNQAFQQPGAQLPQQQWRQGDRVTGLQPRPVPPQQQRQQRVVEELMQVVKDMQGMGAPAQQRQQPQQQQQQGGGSVGIAQSLPGQVQQQLSGDGLLVSNGGAQVDQGQPTAAAPPAAAAAWRSLATGGGGAAGVKAVSSQTAGDTAAGGDMQAADVAQASWSSSSSSQLPPTAAAGTNQAIRIGATAAAAVKGAATAGAAAEGMPVVNPAAAATSGTFSKSDAAMLSPPHTFMADWLETFCIASFPALDSFSPEDLSATIIAFANAHYVPHELWYEQYLRSTHKTLGELNPSQAAALASGLGRLALLPSRAAADAGLVPSEHWLQDFYYTAPGAKPEGCSVSEVVRLMWGAAVLGFKPREEWLLEVVGRVEGLAGGYAEAPAGVGDGGSGGGGDDSTGQVALAADGSVQTDGGVGVIVGGKEGLGQSNGASSSGRGFGSSITITPHAAAAAAGVLSPPLLGALLQSCISLGWTPSPSLLSNLLFSPSASAYFIAQASIPDASRVLQALGAVGVQAEDVAALGRRVAVAWGARLGELQPKQLVLLLVGLGCAGVPLCEMNQQQKQQEWQQGREGIRAGLDVHTPMRSSREQQGVLDMQQQGQQQQTVDAQQQQAVEVQQQGQLQTAGAQQYQQQGQQQQAVEAQQQEQQQKAEQQQQHQHPTALLQFRGAYLAATAAQLPNLSAHQISQLLWAACRCKLQPPREWLLLALDVLQPLLHTTEPKTLARVIHSLAVLGFRPPADWVGSFLMATQRRFSSRASLVEPQLVVKTLMGLGVLGVNPSQKWLKPMLLAVHAKLYQLQPKDVSLLLVALARLGCRPSPVYLEKVLLPLHDLNPDRCSDEVLISLAWGLGKLQWRPPGVWMKGYLGILEPRLTRFSAEGLKTVLWGLAALRVGTALSNKWRAAAVSALLPKVGHMSPKLLCSLAWSLGKLGFKDAAMTAVSVSVSAQHPLQQHSPQQQQQQQIPQQQQQFPQQQQQQQQSPQLEEVEKGAASSMQVDTPDASFPKVELGSLSSKSKGVNPKRRQLVQQVSKLHAVLLCRALELRESFSSREVLLLLVGVAEMQLQPGQQWLQQMIGGPGARGDTVALTAVQAAGETAGGTKEEAVVGAAAAAAGDAVPPAAVLATGEPVGRTEGDIAVRAAVMAAVAAGAVGAWDTAAGAGGARGGGGDTAAVAAGELAHVSAGAKGGGVDKAGVPAVRAGRATARVGSGVPRHQQRRSLAMSQFPGVQLVLLLKSLAQLGFRAEEGWLRDVEVLLEVAWLEEERWARYSGEWALGRLRELAAAGPGLGQEQGE